MRPLVLSFKTLCAVLIFFVRTSAAHAQSLPSGAPPPPSFPVTDSAPALLNGLQAGYIVTGESEKEVGDKGNFSRYKLRFYVTNTSSEAKILFFSQWGDPVLHADKSVPELVQFVCQNATGARLTSKGCSLSASPCNLEVLIDDKDAHGNAVQIRRMAHLGYWIKPGETISTNVIMIVPLGERPQVLATFFPVTHSFAASFPYH